MKKRIRAVQGGTSASKTISILLVLIDLAQADAEPTITSVVSETLPHLKRGAIKDFLSIMESHRYFQAERWNKSDFTYTFETGSKIEFFSADQPGKVRGPRRDRLFINEANNVPYETFDQLEVRTKELIFLDWNPVAEFWVYDQVIGSRDDVEHVTLTYRDNEALSSEIVRSIEQRKDKPAWWRVYGLGQLGEVDGKIYSGWQMIDEVPHEARLWRRGLDFGYSVDPTASVDIYEWNGGYVLDELLYEPGLSNRKISDVLLGQEVQSLIIGDSSEPKSIDEMKGYGVKIIGAKKGPGSVSQGIKFVQDQRISVTKRSVNVIREYRNYLWLKDKDGKILDVPQDWDDHAMDAVRYGFNGAPKETKAPARRAIPSHVPYASRFSKTLRPA